MVQGVDYRVPLSAQGLDLNGAIDNYYKYQQNKRQNALLDLKKAHLDDESRIKSMARFALEIKPLAEAGDMAGLQRAYNRRIGEIKSRNGNPSDSMEIAPYLMSGDTESIKQMADGAINLAREFKYLAAPPKVQTGRFKHMTMPDGSIASLDTATNQMTPLSEAPSIDLSVLPEDVRVNVAKLPREQQVKVVESYVTPKAQADLAESSEKDSKAKRVTNDVKRLVTELLANKDGVKSAVGGLDEFFPTFSDSTRDAEAALEDLINLLTVDNLGLMSGVLSESDMKIIASVGSNGLSGSDKRVWDSLNRMARALGIELDVEPQQNRTSRGRREARRNPQTNYDETDINNLVIQYAD